MKQQDISFKTILLFGWPGQHWGALKITGRDYCKWRSDVSFFVSVSTLTGDSEQKAEAGIWLQECKFQNQFLQNVIDRKRVSSVNDIRIQITR